MEYLQVCHLYLAFYVVYLFILLIFNICHEYLINALFILGTHSSRTFNVLQIALWNIYKKGRCENHCSPSCIIGGRGVQFIGPHDLQRTQ